MPDQYSEISFPLKGVDVSQPFQEQPIGPLPDKTYARTCAYGVNCRAYEPSADVARGGSRPGLVQHISSALPSYLQDLDIITYTAGSAVAEGGGFQPNPSQYTGELLWVGYEFTTEGITIALRLLSDALQVDSTAFTNTSIFGALPNNVLVDFQSAAAGFKATITVQDEASNTVSIGGTTNITLSMHTDATSGVKYLGMPATAFPWLTTYASNPTLAKTYTVTVALLDSNSNPVQRLDANGLAFDGNVSQSFSADQFSGLTLQRFDLWQQTISLSANFNLAINLDNQTAAPGDFSPSGREEYATIVGLQASFNAVSPFQTINWRRVPILAINTGTPPYSAVTNPRNPLTFPQGQGAYVVNRTISAAYASQQTVYTFNDSPTNAMLDPYQSGGGIGTYIVQSSGTATAPSLNHTTFSVAWTNATIHSTTYNGLGDLGPSGVPSGSTGVVATPAQQSASYSPNFSVALGWFNSLASHQPTLDPQKTARKALLDLVTGAVNSCLQSYTQQFAGTVSNGLMAQITPDVSDS